MTESSTPPAVKTQRSNRVSKARGQPASNPFIFTKKTVFMQRVSDLARAGHVKYFLGQTPLEKVAFKVIALADRYPVNLRKAAALEARKSKKSIYRWLGFFDEKTRLVYWVVMAWPGGDFDTQEKWSDALQDRLKVTGYELVRKTRAGAKTPSWTWQYTSTRMTEIREELIDSIRLRQDVLVTQRIHSLYRSPGFAGIRDQVKKVKQLIDSEWKRIRATSEVRPNIPSVLGYVRRLPDVGLVWSELMKKGVEDGTSEGKKRASDDQVQGASRPGGEAEKG